MPSDIAAYRSKFWLAIRAPRSGRSLVVRGFRDSYRGDGWSVSSPNAVSGQLPSGRRPGQTIVRRSEASHNGDHGRSAYSQHLFLAQKHGRLGSLGFHATSGLVIRRSPRRRQTSYESRQARIEQARVLLAWSRQLAPCSANGLECVFRQIVVRSLFFKASYVWDHRRPRPRVK